MSTEPPKPPEHRRGRDLRLSTSPVLVSIVVPVLDEVDTVAVLAQRIGTVFEKLHERFRLELLFVDDGSTDGTRDRLELLAATDPRVRVLEMSRNFGHQMAITAGIDLARGDLVVVMDGDLQDPPEVVARMIDSWREGADVVYGVRRSRHGETRLKTLAASLHYRLLRWLSDTPIPVDTGDFRLMTRQVVDVLQQMNENPRYLRGMVAWVGFDQRAVEFDRDPRFAGTAKYDFKSLLRLSLDGITSFTERPLTLVSQLGMSVTLVAGLYALWIIASRLLGLTDAPGGFAAIMTTIIVLGGLQLTAIGLVGQYLGRVYRQTKARPLYVVAADVHYPTAPDGNEIARAADTALEAEFRSP